MPEGSRIDVIEAANLPRWCVDVSRRSHYIDFEEVGVLFPAFLKEIERGSLHGSRRAILGSQPGHAVLDLSVRSSPPTTTESGSASTSQEVVDLSTPPGSPRQTAIQRVGSMVIDLTLPTGTSESSASKTRPLAQDRPWRRGSSPVQTPHKPNPRQGRGDNAFARMGKRKRRD